VKPLSPFPYHNSGIDIYIIRSNKMQQYAGIYLLQNYSTWIGCPSHPSSGAHKTVTAVSGTGHTTYHITFLQRGLMRLHWRKVVIQVRDMTRTRSCSCSFSRCSPKLTHKKFSYIFNCIKSSITPKLFFYIVSFI